MVIKVKLVIDIGENNGEKDEKNIYILTANLHFHIIAITRESKI